MARAAKPGQEAAGSFLARWSRRKVEARNESAGPGDSGADRLPPHAAETDAVQAHEQEQALTDADMPPLETLSPESDFTPFMSPGVSDGLRQQALRILFRQPAFNVTDGLNDYDADYRQFAGLGSVVSQEMKRMLKRELEAGINRQQQAAARAQPEHTGQPDAEAADDDAAGPYHERG